MDITPFQAKIKENIFIINVKTKVFLQKGYLNSQKSKKRKNKKQKKKQVKLKFAI